MNNRKIFVLDTSVLLYDKKSISSFPGNDVVIPIVVLDELDRFKEKPGMLGENARYINRFLDELREKGKLNLGVEIKEGQTISVSTKASTKVSDYIDMDQLELDKNDNKILATALFLKSTESDKQIVLVTKDINLRVKCDALDILAEDYYKDHIDQSDFENMFSGVRTFETEKSVIDEFYQTKRIMSRDISNELLENEFIIAKSNQSSMIGIHSGGMIRALHTFSEEFPIEAKNKEQKFCLHLLNDPGIELVTITGKAGTGKTFLTLVSAVEKVMNKDMKRIVVTRTMQPVGKEIGFLPGDINEKVEPWMGSIKDNFRAAYGNIMYYETMLQKGQIEITPISLIRGRTFNDTYIIVDEAQNSSIHELKTLITRVGENSKIVLLGDIDQIDTPYLDAKSSGLSIVIDKLKKLKETGHVHLEKGERSNLATKASRLL
jgi:PhoH-like ATPase